MNDDITQDYRRNFYIFLGGGCFCFCLIFVLQSILGYLDWVSNFGFTGFLKFDSNPPKINIFQCVNS